MKKKVNSPFGFRKLFICSLIFYFSGSLNACSIRKPFHLENHLGLYKLVDKECSVSGNSFNLCDNSFFMELVKGQFAGIKDSEIAYVFWSGDPEIDPALQYTAQLIKNNSTFKITGNKFWLNNNSNMQEYFGFSKGKLNKYYLRYMAGNQKIGRTIKYTLIPAKRSSEPHFHLNYPGNE